MNPIRRRTQILPRLVCLAVVGAGLMAVSPALASSAPVATPAATVSAPAATPSAATPSSTGGGVSRGGFGVNGKPAVLDVICLSRCVSGRRATPGATVVIKGGWLSHVRRVVFRGRSGPIQTRPLARRSNKVRAHVPPKAISGRPYVIGAGGAKSNRSPHRLAVLPPSAIPTQVFPIRGPHSYGGAEGRFGAPRSGHIHQGQDVMAACGTPLVAVRHSKVRYNAYEANAGNYVVLHNIGTNTDYVYMHLIVPARVKVGQVLGAGRRIGRVGETGDATGCHLHFEEWVGPWYGGGYPIDPLPLLKSLDRKH